MFSCFLCLGKDSASKGFIENISFNKVFRFQHSGHPCGDRTYEQYLGHGESCPTAGNPKFSKP